MRPESTQIKPTPPLQLTRLEHKSIHDLNRRKLNENGIQNHTGESEIFINPDNFTVHARSRNNSTVQAVIWASVQ